MYSDYNFQTNENHGPDTKTLRHFGFIFSAFIVVFFGMILPHAFDEKAKLAPFVVSCFCFLTAIISPRSLGLVYEYWMKIGHVLGKFNTKILLFLVYYGLFVPMGFLLQFCHFDPLQLELDPKARTYRRLPKIKLNYNAQQLAKSMEKPY